MTAQDPAPLVSLSPANLAPPIGHPAHQPQGKGLLSLNLPVVVSCHPCWHLLWLSLHELPTSPNVCSRAFGWKGADPLALLRSPRNLGLQVRLAARTGPRY